MTNITDISIGGPGTVARATPVSASAMAQAAGAPRTYSTVTDSVSLSALATSLRDESLIVFNALSDEQRGQLVSIVGSGQMTGEEVHEALTQRLKEARSSALRSATRMFNNDNAELYFDDGTSTDDLKSALGATLARRATLLETMSFLSEAGRDGSAEYKALSDDLSARDLNPALSRDRSHMERYISPAFLETDLTDSRLMSTWEEGDAAYKLQSLGVDLKAIDKALRPIGEQDAAAILSERAGLPSSRTVPHDADFSMDRAIFQPFAAKASPGAADAAAFVNDRRAQARALLAGIQSSATPQWIDMPSATARPKLFSGELEPVAPQSANDLLKYIKGLQARY